jgi:glycosyltransferase involved in cell wall biosynthesis
VKAVIALTQPPLAEGGAAGRCAVGLIRGLVANGVDVTAVAARQEFAEAGDPPADLPVEVVDVRRAKSGWRARGRMLLRPRSHLSRSAFGERVRELAQSADVLHLEEIDTTWCDEGISTPALAHLHFLVRRDRSLGPPWRRQFISVAEFMLAERAAIRRYPALVASSPKIADHLREHAPKADVVWAPLTLDPNDYPAASLDGTPVAGIIGTASWSPTANALERLLTHVWPRVHARVPEARLRIAGRDTELLRGAESVPGVEVVGPVASARDFISGLSVLLYPLGRGSGMKVKVMEALASGVPVVTTPAGTEGIDAGGGVIVETENDRLAEAAAAVLRDEAERRERGAEGRRLFAERYNPKVATAPLVALYERLAR